jgi:homoserine O-acetyltransferase
MSETKYFEYNQKFMLESGDYLPGFQLAYNTFGKINAKGDNVIWVIHAFSANSNPTEWWPGVVGKDTVIDPAKYFIVCANSLGSHYGSTGPLSVNPETGSFFFHDFPQLTNRDIVRSFNLLRKELGINKVKLVVGPSLGGQQCLEWGIQEPEVFDNLCLIGTNAFHSPWGIAYNESQRMAIEVDPTWKNKHPDAGLNGMKVARSIALLSYRTALGYNDKQSDDINKLDNFLASSYQRYQGEKLAIRFNAFSYWYLSKMMDSHNVGRNRGTIEEVLKQVKINTTVVGLESDLLFPLFEQHFLVNNLSNAQLRIMNSILGHDGFLTEADQVSTILNEVLAQTPKVE